MTQIGHREANELVQYGTGIWEENQALNAIIWSAGPEF